MYIYESQIWPNFVWDKDKINSLLNEVCRAAGFLSGRLSGFGFDKQQLAVVETLTRDVVDSSEIEGVVLNTDQVRSSVARRLGVQITKETEPSHYIEGVVEMMLDATVNFSKPLSDERLFGWHAALFPTGHSGHQPIDVAQYRKGGMSVISGMLGREKVHYRAPEAELVPQMMAEFIEWFNSKDTPNNYLKSAIAHLWFVCIHPFDDGNGRIARAISDMALSQADNSQMRYFSMSRQINLEKKKYYAALEHIQNSDGDITDWLEWYLGCMKRSVESSDKAVSLVLAKAIFWQRHADVPLNDRQVKVLNFYLDGYDGKLTAKNWSKEANVSLDTAARDIQDLVEKGLIEAVEGKVRNVEYVMK